MMGYPWPMVLCACLLVFLPALASAGVYIEDFTTLDYCNTTITTARWDTASGELKLPDFSITQVGRYPVTTYTVLDVAVAGDYAYVPNIDRLVVVDISDPSNPTYAGSCDGLDFARGVAVSGNHVYVADGSAGLKVIGIHHPTSPVLIGSYGGSGAVDVVVDGDYAYLSSTGDGVVIVDVTSPSHPVYEGGWDSPGSVYGVAISGNRAYVADYEEGLHVLDISDPASPTLVGSYDTPYYAMGVAVSGDHAYVADGSDLIVVDISTPSSPALAGSYHTPTGALRVVVEGNYAYVSDDQSGLEVIDISDPSNPVLAHSYDTPYRAKSAVIEGEHAYVADGDSGLVVLDIADPVIPPIPAGYYGTPTFCLDVAISGDYAYVVLGDATLRVLDISDPMNPMLVASGNGVPTGYAVAVYGDYLLVGGEYLAAFDISNPASPTLVDAYAGVNHIRDIAVSGEFAYLTAWAVDPCLARVYVADPTNLLGDDLITLPGEGRGLAVAGNLAYVAMTATPHSSDSSGFFVAGVGFPMSRLGYCDPGPAFESVVVTGDRAYAGNPGLVYVFDVSDSLSPSAITYRQACGFQLAQVGNYLLGTGSGLDVIDITDSDSPVVVGGYDTEPSEWTRGIAISGDHAYLAAEASVRVFGILQREYGIDHNIAQSLTIAPGDLVTRVKLLATTFGTISWSVSAVPGGRFQSITPSNSWVDLLDPGTDLRWHAVLHYDQAGLNPTCSYLRIDYEVDVSGADGVSQPTAFSLATPYPSPFVSMTRVRFALPRREWVRLSVHDVLGREVAELVDAPYEAGEFSKPWDGRNGTGERVGPGVYYVRFQAGDFRSEREVIVLR